MKVSKVKRVFEFKEIQLPDPGENMTPDQVIDFYSNTYPEMLNSNYIESLDQEKQVLTIEIVKVSGTKG
jgi:PRTRC genetic system protein C